MYSYRHGILLISHVIICYSMLHYIYYISGLLGVQAVQVRQRGSAPDHPPYTFNNTCYHMCIYMCHMCVYIYIYIYM